MKGNVLEQSIVELGFVNFPKANADMTDSIDLKVQDSKNVDYAEVHTSIYQEVGLTKKWRVEKSMKSTEIYKAKDGFQVVTEGLEPFPDKSIPSRSLLNIILSLFKKK